MSSPLVSICLPNLNTLPYLGERVDTILRQTYTNWELVVSDNYSDDGAWAFFEKLARADRRVSIAQAPREGMYANWNRCIDRARGDFVYIATSDDTMPPDCLEKLAAALNANPGCDIAHCPLRAIDGSGGDCVETSRWWMESSPFAASCGPLLHRGHIRRAPFDGLLHLLGSSVYVSITQLLIRRTLFDRIGHFESRWGSVGDFNWNMRAGLVANTIHVPDTWGGWRVHPSQATAAVAYTSQEHALKVDAMIDHALDTCTGLPGRIGRPALARWRQQAGEFRAYAREFETRRTRLRRAALAGRRVLAGSAAAREHLALRIRRRPMSDWVTSRLSDAGFEEALVQAVSGPQAAVLPERELHPSPVA